MNKQKFSPRAELVLMSHDDITAEAPAITAMHISPFVSSLLQKMCCTRRVSESNISAGTLVIFLLLWRFLARCLVWGCFWRRNVNGLPGDRVVEAGCWV